MRSVVLALLISVMAFSQVSPIVINVPGEYPTIQEGINNASDGDTVLVDQGTYLENVNFKGKGILLTSNFIFTRDSLDIYNTIIEGGYHSSPDTGSCVLFVNGETESSQLVGFSLTNGLGTTTEGDYVLGDGIYCNSAEPLIKHNYIHSNGNILSYGGGGIAFINDSFPIIMHNIIHNNDNSNGGGIFSFNSQAHIYNNIISNNYAFNYGGGIDGILSELIIQGNLISSNYAGDDATRGWGGGIHLYLSHNSLVVNNTVFDNRVDQYGGGISIEWSTDVVVENNIIVNNESYGLVVASPPGYVTLLFNDIWSNEVGDYSGIEPGEFDISKDPQFMDEPNNDFNLQSGSPCIDAGNPDSPNVPWGGFRRDMGAFEYDQGFYFDGQNTIYKPDIPVPLDDIAF